MASNLKEVAALGRPFTLGTLYDARKDALIPGLTLWDDKTLQEKLTEHVQSSSHFAITASDTIESKASLLDVEASLKASFLCGLIEVEGSAKYLNDQKKFKNQSRVTCQFKSTTHFKQLSMFDLLTLDAHQVEVIKKSSATHIVTGILYGANSFFVFDSQKLEASSVEDIQGSMKAVMNKIPILSVEAEARIKLTDEEKSLTNSCSCKFFGDFLLKSIPVTFNEAVKTCAQLPQLLGEKGENAVAMKVWLMPLKYFFPEAAEVKSKVSVEQERKMQEAAEQKRKAIAEQERKESVEQERKMQEAAEQERKMQEAAELKRKVNAEQVRKMQEAAELMKVISVGLVGKMQDALEDLREIRMRCNDSLEDGVVDKFPCIHEEFKNFQKLCAYYASDLQKTMVKKLPSIREGKEDESSLEEVFDDRDKSPFSQEKLSKWLDDKEREINVIRSCVDTMKGAKIVRNQSELDREVLAGDVDHALCFVFTSMIRGDTDLDEMATYLDSTKIRSTNEDQWFSSNEVFTTMREKAQTFHDLIRTRKNNKRFRFLITSISNEKHKGATIYHYKKGILVTEDFSKPGLPVEKITDRRDLTWCKFIHAFESKIRCTNQCPPETCLTFRMNEFVLVSPSDACDLTLDPNTANNNLILSAGNKKATNTSESQSYPDHLERFDEHRQVLCTEELSGRHYWEVEWTHDSTTDKYVHAAVAYKRIDRKEGLFTILGRNSISWCFGQYSGCGQHTLEAFQNSTLMEPDFPSGGIPTLGVYLDWPAGTLSFYKVSSDTLSHLHTFHTTFNEPVYPGFWVNNENNYVYLRPVQ